MKPPEDTTNCPHSENILAYLSDDLSEREMLALEEHLAGCKNCIQTAVEIRSIKNALSAIASGSRLHRATSPVYSGLTASVMCGLEEATRRSSGSMDERKASRFNQWLRLVSGNLQSLPEKLPKDPIGLKSLQYASLQAMREFGWAWLQLIELPSVLGTPGLLRDGGKPGNEPQETSAQSGMIQCRVERVPASNDMEVIAKSREVELDDRIVLLIPVHSPEKTLESRLRNVSRDEWCARFENVPPGEYAVAIEPLLETSSPGH